MTFRNTTLAATLALSVPFLATQVAAQSTFERMETLAETMNAMMNDAFIAEIPELEGNLPDPEFDDELRAAYRCMYDGYVEIAGEDAVADMVTEMEASLETLSPLEVLEGGGAPDNPEGVTDEMAQQIVAECGMIEVFMSRMAESGAMEVLMQQ